MLITQLDHSLSVSPLTPIHDIAIKNYGNELWIKRDDLLHPVISGNKWRKLKYILNQALALESHTLISMGGAYSNHLHALAYIGHKLGLNTIGFIRGEQIKLTPTLKDMQDWGMVLNYISRTDYRSLRQYKNCYDFPDIQVGHYWIPEGGSQVLALQGVTELVGEIDIAFDHICVACGTGTTLAGIIKAVPDSVRVTGIAVLKNADFLVADVENLVGSHRNNWEINNDYHFGGFAGINEELMTFINNFQLKHKIQLEPVYTGKLLYAIYDLMKKGFFKSSQCIVAVHTGGLQGNRGFGLSF